MRAGCLELATASVKSGCGWLHGIYGLSVASRSSHSGTAGECVGLNLLRRRDVGIGSIYLHADHTAEALVDNALQIRTALHSMCCRQLSHSSDRVLSDVAIGQGPPA